MTIESLLTRFTTDRFATRLWAHDAKAFEVARADAAVRQAIDNRMGWLDAPAGMTAHLPALGTLAQGAAKDGLTDIYLLGMGGSSLCAEVLRDVAATRNSGARLVVLDTTDERTVRTVTDGMHPDRALFLVASKSGGTIEVTSLERHFWATIDNAALNHPVGRHFVAITDPDTSLAALAASRGYRQTFINPADIGGRYSALSLFGLVPAALMGLDVAALLASGRAMADACSTDATINPGLALGAFMAAHAAAGRDKLTLLVPPALAPLGVWIEQLVAESTGKLGKGVLPVVGEPIGAVGDYGSDRAFVAITTPGDSTVEPLARRLEAAGHPVFWIETQPSAVGAEFFRWEFATAVAGAGLGVNPFDEPNVRDAKARTQAQLDGRRLTGHFTLDPPLVAGDGCTWRIHRSASRAPVPGRYVAILDYLPADPARAPVIAALRTKFRQHMGAATTHGIGPRYLHSTGQYHKGGPNTGSFVLLTSGDETATPVPGTDFTFSTLKHAQALGDFEALAAAGRDVLHVHLEDPSAEGLAALESVLIGLR